MDETAREAMASKADEKLLNNFIAKNESFILRCASKGCGRYVNKSDDEYSIALMAFTEAIDSYNEEKGPFTAFAALVIRRRVQDYLRGESRHGERNIPVAPYVLDGGLDEEDEAAMNMEVYHRGAELAEERSFEQKTKTSAKEEIEAAQEILKEYGFSFFDLADCSPKAEKTKLACAEAVKAIIKNPELLEKMRKTRTLPIKELAEQSGVAKKILERHRKYIIAAAEIISGEYPILAEYLGYIRKALVT